MFVLRLLTRPLRLVALLLLLALVVGGIWAWREVRSSTPASEEEAVAAFRGGAQAAASRRPGVPRPGVYSYRVDGFERASAGPLRVSRPLPRRAPALVRPTPDGYELEVRFSKEHVEGFRYRVDGRGIFAVQSRTELTFLGVGRDDRRALRPPPLHMPLRPHVGQEWRGTYRAGDLVVRVRSRVLRAETLRIGGRSVPTVVVAIRSDTEGAHPGRRIETLWWSSEVGLPVRHETDLEIHGVVGLTAKATLELVSTQPRTE